MQILFYSSKCKYCDSIISILKSKGLYDSFKCISIDGNNNLPNYLTKVPTLIVPNVNKPLEGKNAFMWINTVFNFNNETNNINNKNYNNTILLDNKGPDGFTKEEMGGVSDSFSFVSDEQDKSIKKNYNYIEDDQEEGSEQIVDG